MIRYGWLPLFALCALASEPVTDEALQVKALRALFPGMEVEALPRRIDSSFRLDLKPPLQFPDALALDPVYRITGSPADDRESCASHNLVKRTHSNERELRIRLYPWPGASRGELLAALQYRFTGALPASECPSLAGLYRLATAGKEWKVVDSFPLETGRHHHIEGLQFLRVTDDDEDDLVLESDSGDPARFESDLHIFLLAHGRFQELLNVPSRQHIRVEGDQWVQFLDVTRTRERGGDQFCFEKTVWSAGNRRFSVPEITHPCYPRGTGVRPE